MKFQAVTNQMFQVFIMYIFSLISHCNGVLVCLLTRLNDIFL